MKAVKETEKIKMDGDGTTMGESWGDQMTEHGLGFGRRGGGRVTSSGGIAVLMLTTALDEVALARFQLRLRFRLRFRSLCSVCSCVVRECM